jgi:hypothetical protein
MTAAMQKKVIITPVQPDDADEMVHQHLDAKPSPDLEAATYKVDNCKDYAS